MRIVEVAYLNPKSFVEGIENADGSIVSRKISPDKVAENLFIQEPDWG